MSLSLSASFRFEPDKMQALAQSLCMRSPVELIAGSDPEVVLAATWNLLWDSANDVLPLSSGRSAIEVTQRSSCCSITCVSQ